MVMKMLTRLERRLDELIENFNKEKIQRKKQS